MDADKKSHDGHEQVETSGGDFIGRDKIVRGDEVHGDKVLGDKVVYTRSQMEELDDYLARAVSAYEADRFSAVAKLPTSVDEPYKFLDAFELEDAHIFFGRDGAKEDLYQTLLKDRLTILHAKSGAGKTSLLNAGLSPRLIREGRLPVYARAYEEPVLAIKQAIAPRSLGPWPELLPKLTLHEFLGLACDKLSRQTQELVIVLDQFEEFFVFWPERGHRQPFIDALAECYEDATLRTRLVIALRKDYYSDLADLEGRTPTVFHNQYRLDTMTRQEAQAAITGPVAKLGRPVDYEQDLLDALLDDLARGGMELPHLQIMCAELCKALAEGEMQITLASYEELGRAEGILTGYLNGVLERLPTGRQALAKEILKELVSSEATKRVLSYNVLVGRIEAEKNELDRTLAWLMDSRLLHREEVEGEVRYEMAHEYLIEEIKEWIDRTDLAFKRAQELLTREVANWRVYKKFLMPKDRLEELHAQRERLRGLDDESREYLLRSALQADFAVEDWARLAGEVGEKLLLSILGGPHEELRRAATRGLGAIWGLSEVSLVGNEDSSVRRWAIEALGQLGDARAVEPLIVALGDEHSIVRLGAALGLGQLGDARVVEPLIAALGDQYRFVRLAAAEALGQLGEPAVEPLIATLGREDSDVRRVAAWGLGQLGDARAAEPLVATLRDADSDVRRVAALGLGQLGDARAVEPLIATLRDADSDVRQGAAEALVQLGEPAVEPLIAALRDEDSAMWQRIASALRRIGTPQALTALEEWKV